MQDTVRESEFNEETAEIKVDGMICPQCEDDIRCGLIQSRGIIDVRSSYGRSVVSVTFDPEIITEDEICGLLTEAGYPPGEGNGGRISDIACIAGIALLCLIIPRITAPGGNVDLTGTVTAMTAFAAGIAGSLHCIGMCGGIMLTQTCGKNTSPTAGSALYNGGRLISYTTAGAVFGGIGGAISYTDQFRSMLFTLCGVLVVLMALRMWGIIPWLRNLSIELPGICRLPASLRNTAGIGRPLIVGILTGLMPCGMLAAMWMAAVSSGNMLNGAMIMLAFSAGTAPVMFIFGAFGAMIPKRYNKYIVKISTALIAALGLLLVLKGLK